MHCFTPWFCGAMVLAGAAAAADPAPVAPPEVAVVARGDGWQFTDCRGMSLYTFESDERGSGTSMCNGPCAQLRPPLMVAGDTPAPDWQAITRGDGTRQWSYKGKPLYAFSRDTYAGGTFGEGNGWSLAFQPIPMPPAVGVATTLSGQVLATPAGLALYVRDADAGACAGPCLANRSPLPAPWSAMALGDFTVAARDDGVSQWAFRGLPLYLFAEDVKSGDTRGEGEGWRAVVLHPAPPRPAWVRVVGTDAGALLADPRGMTIYAYDEDRNKLVYPRGEDCFGPCIAESWTPVAAERPGSPIGNWSVIAGADGGLQWAYKGQPLYTSKLETRPGDLTGISPRRARAWRPIMHATQSIQGASPNG